MKTVEVVTKNYDVAVLAMLFNSLFEVSENTHLAYGAEEPIYLPAEKLGDYHKILSTKDYFSSALHEVSHWCIAGEKRRHIIDYGYWYEPDGRSKEQQRLFEKAEIKPQALEWLFTRATGKRFRLSIDNVNQPEVGISEEFCSNVHRQAIVYLENGLPARADKFFKALLNYYQPQRSFLSAEDFKLEYLQ